MQYSEKIISKSRSKSRISQKSHKRLHSKNYEKNRKNSRYSKNDFSENISLLPDYTEKSIYNIKSEYTKKKNKSPKIVSIDLRGLSNYHSKNFSRKNFEKKNFERNNPPMIFSSKKRKEFDFKIVKNCQKKKIYNDFKKSMNTYDFNRNGRKVRIEVDRLTENSLRKLDFN